ncbi:MAG TPA: response regulator [Aggregicoccus sp.]|nr:response regulator [Aggregicoccus sp.]
MFTSSSSLEGQTAKLETLLVVDDDPDVRDLTAEILRERGYRVLEAGSGEEAVRLAADFPRPIHLLLTDVLMPRMDGPTLARNLCARRPGLKVLYMTGYSGRSLAAADGELPRGTEVLTKPFTFNDLTSRVRAVLEPDA